MAWPVGAKRLPSVQEASPRAGVAYVAVEKATGRIISRVEADAPLHPIVAQRLANREVVLVERNAEINYELSIHPSKTRAFFDLSINRVK